MIDTETNKNLVDLVSIESKNISKMFEHISKINEYVKNSELFLEKRLDLLKIVIESDLFINSYSIININMFDIYPKIEKHFNFDSFKNIRDGYVFYLNLYKDIGGELDIHHKIILISGFSEDYRYLIIFPCIGKMRFVETLEDLLQDYVEVKISKGFTFVGDFVLNIGISMTDIHYTLLYIATNNIETKEDMNTFLSAIDELYKGYKLM